MFERSSGAELELIRSLSTWGNCRNYCRTGTLHRRHGLSGVCEQAEVKYGQDGTAVGWNKIHVNVEWLWSLSTAQQHHCQCKSTCTRARSPFFIGSEFGQTRPVLVSAICFYHLRQLRRIRRSLDADSASTPVHAFVTSRVDYCDAILAGAPKTTTDRLQRMLNAAARVVSDTKKFDLGPSRLMHQELHWLCIPERVKYKLGMLTHRCLLGKAPMYLSNWCIPVAQVATRWRTLRCLRVISWPYLDIVSARTVGEHLLSLVRRCSTLCQMIYEIPQSAQQHSDNRWRDAFSLPISTFSALGVFHVMRYINVRYLLTYLDILRAHFPKQS